jgi:hypothetical protein
MPSRVEPLAKTRDYQSPVKYFEATLSLARTDPSFMKPGQKGASAEAGK